MSLLDEIPTERAMQDHFLGQEYFNQRTFNIHDIMGEFNVKRQIKRGKDMEDRDCNEKGFLIDKFSGDILNKYTFNRMFASQCLSNDG